MPNLPFSFAVHLVALAEAVPPEDFVDYAPGLGIMALIIVVILLILIGVGIAVGITVLGILASLLGLGILTTTTIAGLATRKPTTAAKALVLQIAALAGLAGGAALAVLVDVFLLKNTELTTTQLSIYGGIAGLFSGIALAILFNAVWHRALTLVIDRYLTDPAS